MDERTTPRARRSAALAALALLAACGSSSSDDAVVEPGLGSGVVATNLGVALVDLVGEGNLFVVKVREEDQGGADLNLDGDPFDHVHYVFDARTRSVTNPRLAAGEPSMVTANPLPHVSEDFVVLPVDEQQQGVVDLNGDGDADDIVLHVFEPLTGDLQSLPYAAERFVGHLGLAVDRDYVAFTVPEEHQGNTDINNDGDTSDRFVYLFVRSTGQSARISESASSALYGDGGTLAYSLVENDPQVGDLNGDGDEDDAVLQVRKHLMGLVSNTGQAGHRVMDSVQGSWLFSVAEWVQGEDLNGDMDETDVVYTSYDPYQAVVHNHAVGNTNMFSPRPSRGADLVAVRVQEEAMGRDLNGDGDRLDEVVHALDPVTGETFNSGLAGQNPTFFDGGVGIDVDEVAQGGQDLDGDGLVGGRVVHVFEPRSGAVVNLGVRAQQGIGAEMRSGGSVLLFWRAESVMVGDWNGDGDLSDEFLCWWDPTTNTLSRMSRSGRRVADVLDGTALVWVAEADESEDLNDDGDLFDVLLYGLDLASGQLAATGLGGEHEYYFARLVDARTALLQVPEVAGIEDLNGDGDNFDAVLFLLDLFR